MFFLCSRIIKTDKKLCAFRGRGGSGGLSLECDVIREQVGMRFQTGDECGRGGIR